MCFKLNNVFLVSRAGTKYTVSVFGMFDGGESMPLAGEENTTYSDDPDSSPVDVPSKVTQYYIVQGNFTNIIHKEKMVFVMAM